jgi:flagellar hook-associated protein 2
MTLTDLATAINTNSSTTGVTATIAKVSDTSYQMVLTGSDINKAIQISGVTGTDVMQSIGVTDGAGAFPNILQPAQPTSIKVDGITYSRDSNSFSDIISGITINVKNADPATTVNLSVENDNSGVKTGIQSFITSYNALRDFIKSQQVVSDTGAVDSSVVLFGDTFMENLNRSLQSILGGNYGSGGTTLSTLRDVGITLDADNKLVMDESKFDTALIDKFSEVRDIFQAKVTVDNTEFRMTKNTSTTGSKNFAMQITMSGGAISGVSVGGDSNLFDFSNGTITGKTGTAYEGMSFDYIGTADTTVNIKAQSGAADMLSTTIDRSSDALDGDISKEMNRISSQNTQLEQRSTRVLERASAYRDNLINKYAAFEAKLAQAQTILAQLQALTKTTSSN